MASDLAVLILIPAASHSAASRSKWVLKVTGRWSNEDHIICKKQWRDPQTTKLQPLPTTTTPRYPVHVYHKQDWWQGTALAETNTHWQRNWLAAKDANNNNNYIFYVVFRPMLEIYLWHSVGQFCVKVCKVWPSVSFCWIDRTLSIPCGRNLLMFVPTIQQW